MRKQILFIFMVFLLISTSTVWAQGFGKNKVTQQQFDWFIHKTEHFDIYYYPNESRLVSVMGDIAEDAYRKFSEDFGHELSERTPLIIYKSHSDFQETNIILEELSEGVGGFAEFFKRRVVIPFTGSMTQFQAVIFHELIHIFQYDIIYQKPVARIYTGEFLYSPPIWFIEGMAEYMSGNWDATDEMVLRNACVSNSIVPLTYLEDFYILGSQIFLGYKEGQSAIEYLVQTYGRDKLANILQELKHSRTKSLDDAFKNTIGTDVQKFDKDWQRSIKRKYWPMIQYKKMPDEIATQLTGKKSESNNFKPVWSVSGDLIAYITSEYGYDEIRIISAKDGSLIERIRKDGYEDIRSEGSGIAWSPDGDKLAFIAKDKKKEYLFVLNIITKKIQHKIQLPFDVSYSPTWAPDNNRIAFAALKDGKTDIYLISLDKAVHEFGMRNAEFGMQNSSLIPKSEIRNPKSVIRQLTDDPFDDNHPSWHPVLDKVIYSSEREGKYKLFVIDLDSQTQIPPAPFNKGGAMQLTHGQQNAVSPSWSRDGAQIIFCSDLNSIYDVYSMDNDGNFTRLTDIMTGCFNPSLSPDKRKILFSAYDDGRQNIFVMDMDKAVNEKIDMPPLNKESVAITTAQDEEEHRLLLGRKKYSTSLVLDAIFTDFQYSADGLLQNTTQLIASDMMGNHRFGLSVAANQSGFLTPDFIASYFYLSRRTDYGAAFFNYHEYYVTIDRYLIAQRNTGLLGFLSYPLDRYRRIELQTLIYSTPFDFKYYTSELDAARGTIVSSEISYIKDTTMWNEFGPYSGTRYILDVEHSLPSLGSDLEMTNVILDSRKYFRLGKRTCLATRMLLGGSFGSDHALFYIGGIDTMRGYGYEDLAGTRVGLLNLELRIPFIDELRFGWPFAWSISGIRGILFTDFGTVWSKWQFGPENRYKALIRTGNKIQLVDVKNSVGIGLRLKLGFFDLNFDIAKRTNLTQFTDDKTRFHFGLGQEF